MHDNHREVKRLMSLEKAAEYFGATDLTKFYALVKGSYCLVCFLGQEFVDMHQYMIHLDQRIPSDPSKT